MSASELDALALDIRQDLIKFVSKNGGHLASNLGIVELTLALHKVFDTPKDKIIFDVGHQSYVHKMLTGRYEDMENLRNYGGISGFPKIDESAHDMFNSGHSGTSIGACLGYATARDLKNENYSCISVIGDGSLTAGVAWEALNLAGASKTPMIVIINDNTMSISGNIGGIPKHLRKLRTSHAYNKFKDSIKAAKLTGLQKFLVKFRNLIKYTMVPGAIFEELGFKYYGPIDGHNIDELTKTLEFAKTSNRPIVLHVVTRKGKGFGPAEENPSKYHGIGKFDVETADAVSVENKNSWSSIFGDELSKIADEDEKVVAVSAAMIDGTGLGSFKEKHPNRMFDVGIAEQNAVAFASGLALNGLKPAVALYSTFLQRAFDQVLSEVALQKLPIIFAVDRAGITGQDGETHQGQFDIAYLKLIPGITILSPRDESSLRQMLRYAHTLDSTVAIRYGRGNAPKAEKWNETTSFDPKPEVIKEGKDVIIFSDGNSLPIAIDAAEKLENIDASVCDLKVLKPLDKEEIIKIASNYKYVITVEDGTICGGVGEEISAILIQSKLSINVLNIAWPDAFIPHGTVSKLREVYEMDANGIAKKIKEFYEKKA
ncbi:MAG: 1-deoxy-D-xylulose-5-phosphate synthase [Clostridia bacterium]|nr:1-deoxy-D-xylulose-5-phosphate synthase [Clostridia bacterium]